MASISRTIYQSFLAGTCFCGLFVSASTPALAETSFYIKGGSEHILIGSSLPQGEAAYSIDDGQIGADFHQGEPELGIDAAYLDYSVLPFWNMRFIAGDDQLLLPGIYENAGDIEQPQITPGMLFSSIPEVCTENSGRFEVLEAEWDYDEASDEFELTKFSVNFEHYCEDINEPLYGAYRFNATNEDVFIRGDANNDRDIDIADAVMILNALFEDGGEGAPAAYINIPNPCADAADVDDDGTYTIGDAVTILNYLFLDAAAPPAPNAGPGIDTTADDIPGCGLPEPSVVGPAGGRTSSTTDVLATNHDERDIAQ